MPPVRELLRGGQTNGRWRCGHASVEMRNPSGDKYSIRLAKEGHAVLGRCHTMVALLSCLVWVPQRLPGADVVTVASHALVRPLVGNRGVVPLGARECETLFTALAGAGQLAPKDQRHAPRPREARAALDRT